MQEESHEEQLSLGLSGSSQSPREETTELQVKVEPRLEWRFQVIGHSRIVGHLPRRVDGMDESQSKPSNEAVCAAGVGAGGLGLPSPLEAIELLYKAQMLGMRLQDLVAA